MVVEGAHAEEEVRNREIGVVALGGETAGEAVEFAVGAAPEGDAVG